LRLIQERHEKRRGANWRIDGGGEARGRFLVSGGKTLGFRGAGGDVYLAMAGEFAAVRGGCWRRGMVVSAVVEKRYAEDAGDGGPTNLWAATGGRQFPFFAICIAGDFAERDFFFGGCCRDCRRASDRAAAASPGIFAFLPVCKQVALNSFFERTGCWATLKRPWPRRAVLAGVLFAALPLAEIRCWCH